MVFYWLSKYLINKQNRELFFKKYKSELMVLPIHIFVSKRESFKNTLDYKNG